MPLLKCGDCQSNYSDYAPACPDCARPTNTQINFNYIPSIHGKYPRVAKQGDDLRYDYNISSEDAISGKKIEITIPKLENCNKCKGTGNRLVGRSITCKKCKGFGQVNKTYKTLFGIFYQVKECSSCRGFGMIPCKSCGGKGIKRTRKDLSVNIPPGVDTGWKLRVNGEGNAGIKGGVPGDLYIFIRKLK